MDALPSIAQLERLFGSPPVSVAETALGQVLPLAKWPEGEVKVEARTGGRAAIAYLNPRQRHVSIEVRAQGETIAQLDLREVDRVDAVVRAGGVAALNVTLDRQLASLSVRPDVRVLLRAGVPKTTAEHTSGEAQWYADPSGRFELRYWNGDDWTEHVFAAGSRGVDPPVY
ncbi:MAG: DUF2510 domain-containing protein [Ilumatobacter sp.]|uniref:DUF2510 domain-containing protein n=1 Tax=Ilumatobacter sp. TaxID=1967498 RepID=UPI00261B9673|nr:DUF2510 domain-containing protein [Ilumatobacter sp.]MDJ0770822.1 DUF2510 domain-containing protein [Ilumatobacter sp.]